MVDVRDRTLQALVLRARDHKEQDRLLTLASEAGPEAVIARGARKSGHVLSSCAQPFCLVTVTLSPAKDGVSFLKEGRQEESYLPAGGDLARFAYLSYFSELLLAGWPHNRPEPGLYLLSRAAFVLTALDDDLERTARWFELRFLGQLGLLPRLTDCAQCDFRPGTDWRPFYLSPQRGRLLCAKCAIKNGQDSLPPLSPGATITLHRLAHATPSQLRKLRLTPSMKRELDQALSLYLAYHLDYAARARAMLKQLL